MCDNRQRKRKLQTLRFWHRTLGIVSALFVIALVVTGLLLNHTEKLRLDSHYIRTPLLLDLYDINPPGTPKAFAVGAHWISLVGERLYMDAKELPESPTDLMGAVQVDGNIAIALPARLMLVDPGGQIIEKLGGAEGVPAGMRAIGLSSQGDLVVRGAHGNYRADLDVLEWTGLSSPGVSWAEPKRLPADLHDQLIAAYRGTGLPVERVILDLHSGRLLGDWGVYVIDGAALLFLTLAVSGVWMWARRPRR